MPVEVSAVPYKLLLYDQGWKFLTHRNTKKKPGNLRTLVVQLPCCFKGGMLKVRL